MIGASQDHSYSQQRVQTITFLNALMTTSLRAASGFVDLRDASLDWMIISKEVTRNYLQ